MEVWAIEWQGYGDDHIDRQKIFTKKEDAEECLKDIIKGKTYDYLPRIIHFEINEYYDANIWYDKWGFSGKRKQIQKKNVSVDKMRYCNCDVPEVIEIKDENGWRNFGKSYYVCGKCQGYIKDNPSVIESESMKEQERQEESDKQRR